MLANYVKLQLSLMPLFLGAPSEAIARLSTKVELRNFGQGQFILEQAHDTHCICVLSYE